MYRNEENWPKENIINVAITPVFLTASYFKNKAYLWNQDDPFYWLSFLQENTNK